MYVRILEEEKHHQVRMFAIFWKMWKKSASHIPEIIAVVAESVSKAPTTSIYRRSQQLNISETSLGGILHKDLSMMPYKVQMGQELKPIGHPMRFCFAKSVCERLAEDADFGKKKKTSFQMKLILILYGIWSTDFGFWSRCIIGSFFFENEQGVAVTLNGDRYLAMLNEFLFTKI